MEGAERILQECCCELRVPKRRVNEISELDIVENPYVMQITHSVAVEIGNLIDNAFIDSVKRWAETNKLDEVYLLDSDTMKRVFALGIEAHKRMYGDVMCKRMEFVDGKQTEDGWRMA